MHANYARILCMQSTHAYDAHILCIHAVSPPWFVSAGGATRRDNLNSHPGGGRAEVGRGGVRRHRAEKPFVGVPKSSLCA